MFGYPLGCRLTRKQPWDDDPQLMSCGLQERMVRHLAWGPSPDLAPRSSYMAFLLTPVSGRPWALHPRNLELQRT